jgi:hypothetical protein
VIRDLLALPGQSVRKAFKVHPVQQARQDPQALKGIRDLLELLDQLVRRVFKVHPV